MLFGNFCIGIHVCQRNIMVFSAVHIVDVNDVHGLESGLVPNQI